jgi:hypothetical protein
METLFDFTQLNNEYIYKFNSNILHIVRLDHSVAVLYFTDIMNIKKNIPEGIIVYSYDHENNKKKVAVNPENEEYTLDWTYDYIIQYNDKVLLHIKKQRKWMITS